MAYVSTRLNREIRIDKIVTVHYFEYARHFAFCGEAHDFWEFLYVDKGVVEVRAGDTRRTLRRGDLIFHRPMEFHAVKAGDNTAPSLAVVSFVCTSPAMARFYGAFFRTEDAERRLISRVITEARQAFAAPLNLPDVEKLSRRPAASFGAEQLVGAALEELLIRLARRQDRILPLPGAVGGRLASVPLPDAEADGRDAQTLRFVLDYLRSHLGERRTVSQIADAVLISRSSLQELFHRALGCGVMQYFTRMKVEAARQLLQEGGRTCAQVAELLAFGSPSYFARCFGKETGMTPREYADSVNRISDAVSRAARRTETPGPL